jgi:hypothetical protein
MPQVESQFIATWSAGNPNAYIWTVRGITEYGVYITSPQSRSPGHLISHREFTRDYTSV